MSDPTHPAVPHPTHPAVPHRRATGWLRLGIALVVVGALVTMATFVPLFTGGDPLPVGFYLASMLAPLGLGLILWTFWRQARARGRRTRTAR